MDRGSGKSKAQVIYGIRFTYWGAVVLWALVIAMIVTAGMALAKSSRGTVWFSVPSGVTEVRVRSYKNGKIVMDRSLSVVPGQSFRIDPQ
jgi:hypothetical protein